MIHEITNTEMETTNSERDWFWSIKLDSEKNTSITKTMAIKSGLERLK